MIKHLTLEEVIAALDQLLREIVKLRQRVEDLENE